MRWQSDSEVRGASLGNLVVGPPKLVGKTLQMNSDYSVIYLENVCIIETPQLIALASRALERNASEGVALKFG